MAFAGQLAFQQIKASKPRAPLETKSVFLGDKPARCAPLLATPQSMTQGDFSGRMTAMELGYFSPQQLS